MSPFASYRSYDLFAAEVRGHRRFIRTIAQDEFLRELLITAQTRVQVLPEKAQCWRAQKGCGYAPYEQDGVYIDDMAFPHPVERMTPRKDKATEGRANPLGIPVFYGSDDRDTAVAELRPWVGASVSVGIFQALRELRVVNCTSDDRRRLVHFAEPDPEVREREVWNSVDSAFARPLETTDETAHYAPTQMIAEAIKTHGFDGLFFRSSVGKGLNLALFDTSAVRLIHCEVVTVKALAITVEPDSGPYSVKRYPFPLAGLPDSAAGGSVVGKSNRR